MILVVDDDPDLRKALVRLLRAYGYAADAVSSGEEAIGFLTTHGPRLVVLDYGMPDMDGLTAFREIRKDPRLAEVRVIMFSAHDNGLREAALGEGIDAFVAKDSLDWHLLRQEIQRLVGPPPRAASAPVAGAKPRAKTRDGESILMPARTAARRPRRYQPEGPVGEAEQDGPTC